MSQYAVPIATVATFGTFDSTPVQVPSQLHFNVDDSPADPKDNNDGDTSFISANPPVSQEIDFKFGPLLPPIDLLNVRLYIVAKKVDPITGDSITAELWQGDPNRTVPPFPVQFAEREYDLSSVYLQNFETNLTAAEAGRITDWSDLHVRLTIQSGTATGEIRITQLFLETSDAQVGAAPLTAVDLKLEAKDVEVVFAPLMVAIPDPVELRMIAKDVEVVFGPKVITAADFDVEVRLPNVGVVIGNLTITPDPVNVEVRLEDTPVKVNRTIHPSTIVVEVSTPPTMIDGTITPAATVIEITLPPVTVGTAFKPAPVLVEVEVQAPTVVLAPLVLTPDAIVVEVSPIAVDTTITPLTITPSPVDVFVSVPVVVNTRGPKVLTPDDLDVKVDVPTVSVVFGPRIILPAAIPVVISVERVSRAAVLLMPDVIIVEVLVPDIMVINPFRVPWLLTPRRPGRRFRPTWTPSVIRFPGPFRGRYRHDARGQYRVFNASEYRFYFRDGAPPDEVDTPYATSATLPATPTTTFADGNWYLSVSLFNGVIDSGFLPLGANGETYQRLKVSGGVAAGEAPHGPGDWRLERRGGGIVSVLGFYYDTSPIRAADWSIGFTTDGTDPPADTPNITVAMPTIGLAVLDHPLPAQVDGIVVKVLLQTRRTGPTLYSERPTVKQAVAAAAVATPTVGIFDRWTGRLPVDKRP